jgi:hypothetical protein
LGLPAVRREMPCAVENPLLLIDDLVDETVDRGEPVRRGEPFEASSAVGRRGITEPAHAFVVVSERRDVLQCVGDVVDLAVRPCVVPVEDAHRSGTAPHQMPQQLMDGGGPGVHRPSDGVAHAKNLTMRIVLQHLVFRHSPTLSPPVLQIELFVRQPPIRRVHLRVLPRYALAGRRCENAVVQTRTPGVVTSGLESWERLA